MSLSSTLISVPVLVEPTLQSTLLKSPLISHAKSRNPFLCHEPVNRELVNFEVLGYLLRG
jgi:hypothetical protein